MSKRQPGAADKRFGENLREARMNAGMTQAEVCRRMTARTGRTYLQQTLTRIENGDQAPQLGEAAELAEIVGHDLSAMTRPPGLAREAWRLLHYAREAREAHDDRGEAGKRLAAARNQMTVAIAKMQKEGHAAALADEIAVARRALADTED